MNSSHKTKEENLWSTSFIVNDYSLLPFLAHNYEALCRLNCLYAIFFFLNHFNKNSDQYKDIKVTNDIPPTLSHSKQKYSFNFENDWSSGSISRQIKQIKTFYKDYKYIIDKTEVCIRSKSLMYFGNFVFTEFTHFVLLLLFMTRKLIHVWIWQAILLV